MEDIQCSGVTFIRNFDSANLAKVEVVTQNTEAVTNSGSNNGPNVKVLPDIPNLEFNIWTTPDCYGTEFQNGNRTWFYFALKANSPSLLLKLNIVDLNKQAKMYSQGMSPVHKIVPSRNSWERIRDKPTYSTENEIFTLTFKYRTPENPQALTYFAFTYPFSYTDLQKMLHNIDVKFANTPLEENDDIYYVRECVCRSLENRRIDLLTITSKKGLSNIRETRLKDLFTDDNSPRPHKFPDKKIIFVSARVHPGETPSSFVFNGFFQLLLNRDNPIAIILRRLYVFKLIPFLNPDGVSRGHYRTDSRGVNLNRMYLNPTLTLHPSIYAARALIRYYHYGHEKPDVITLCQNCAEGPQIEQNLDEATEEQQTGGSVISSKVSNMTLEENKGGICLKLKHLCTLCGSPLKNTTSDENTEAYTGKGDDNPKGSGLFLYLDLHGHASKKGIFLYGNHFDNPDQNVECMLLAKLMSINNANFHFNGCNFTEKNMFIKDKRDGLSRAGSGRVAISTLTGLVKSYTLECNYNTGRIVNILPPMVKDRTQKTYNLSVPPKYTPSVFEEVGRSLGPSILDLTGSNPQSRLPQSEFHTLSSLTDWIRMNCINEYGQSTNCRTKTKINTSQGEKQRRPRVRSTPAKLINKTSIIKKIRPSSVPIERKENVGYIDELKLQPSCSNKLQRKKSIIKIHKKILKKNKTKMALSLKCKNVNDKGKKKLPTTANTTTNQNAIIDHNTTKSIYSWNVNDTTNNNEKNLTEPSSSSNTSTSQNSGFRVTSFSKNTLFCKNKKHTLRRIGTSSESSNKIEKLKKKKRLVKKL